MLYSEHISREYKCSIWGTRFKYFNVILKKYPGLNDKVLGLQDFSPVTLPLPHLCSLIHHSSSRRQACLCTRAPPSFSPLFQPIRQPQLTYFFILLPPIQMAKCYSFRKDLWFITFNFLPMIADSSLKYTSIQYRSQVLFNFLLDCKLDTNVIMLHQQCVSRCTSVVANLLAHPSLKHTRLSSTINFPVFLQLHEQRGFTGGPSYQPRARF